MSINNRQKKRHYWRQSLDYKKKKTPTNLKSIDKLLESVRVSETSTYNVNIQKLTAFSYTRNRLKIC